MYESESFRSGFEFGQLVARQLGYSIIALIPYLFYLTQLQKLLRRVSPDLQKAKPEQIWLLLIPGFRLVWSFMLVTRIGDSLRDEHERRGILEFDTRPGFAIGIAMSCLSVLFRLLLWSDYYLIIGLVAIALLSCWIVYWVKMASLTTQLVNTGSWQNYTSGANPYYQQAWPQPQWPQHNQPQQHDWQRQGMGQQWNQAHYPPATPPTPPQWNQPPAQQQWQPPVPPPQVDPNDHSRWMPPNQ